MQSNFGVVIKHYREKFEWDKDMLCAKADISRPTLYQLEKGKKPSWKTLSKIMKAFCLSVDDLIKDARLTELDVLFLENKKLERPFYAYQCFSKKRP